MNNMSNFFITVILVCFGLAFGIGYLKDAYRSLFVHGAPAAVSAGSPPSSGPQLSPRRSVAPAEPAAPATAPPADAAASVVVISKPKQVVAPPAPAAPAQPEPVQPAYAPPIYLPPSSQIPGSGVSTIQPH